MFFNEGEFFSFLLHLFKFVQLLSWFVSIHLINLTLMKCTFFFCSTVLHQLGLSASEMHNTIEIMKKITNSRWNNIEVYRARDVSFSVIVKIKREMLKLRPSSHLALRLCHSLMELHPFQMTESIMVACTTLQRMHCMHWIYFCYLLIMCVNSSAFILLLMS